MKRRDEIVVVVVVGCSDFDDGLVVYIAVADAVVSFAFDVKDSNECCYAKQAAVIPRMPMMIQKVFPMWQRQL